jgi:hypothetical protein
VEPSPELLAALRDLKPVRTRVPLRSLAGVLALSLLYGGLAFVVRPMRDDLPLLSVTWLVIFGLVWVLGFAVPLAAALLPRRRAVLPDPIRASRVAAAVAALLISIGLVFTPEGRSGGNALRCILFSLKIWAGVFVIALFALRKIAIVGGWRIGAAAGAAGGALGGLLLHLSCPYGGGLHVGLAHGGGVAVCALLGALTAPLFLER